MLGDGHLGHGKAKATVRSGCHDRLLQTCRKKHAETAWELALSTAGERG